MGIFFKQTKHDARKGQVHAPQKRKSEVHGDLEISANNDKNESIAHYEKTAFRNRSKGLKYLYPFVGILAEKITLVRLKDNSLFESHEL